MKKKLPIALATGSVMPKPDRESHLLVEALAGLGLSAEIIPWDADINWGRYSLVVVRTPWDYFQRLDSFLAWLARVDALTRLTNPYRLIAWNCHKGYLRQLAEAGLPTIPTIWLPRHDGNYEQTLAADASFRNWNEIIIKPAVSIGAIDILRARAGSAEASTHIGRLLERDDVMIQPFLPSIASAGEVSLIFFGGKFSHAIRKVPKAGDFRVQDMYGGVVRQHTATEAEIALAHAALDRAPAPSSYARIDLVRYEDRWTIMELEMIEPELFLSSDAGAATAFAKTLQHLVPQ